MRRIVLNVAYDGTEYAGWQRQPKLVTVQGEIERNLRRICQEDITIHGAGRTDAGVHALGQIAHFDTESLIPASKFIQALNVGLPKDIRINDSWETSMDFHSRFLAKSKHYRYSIRNTSVASAISGRFELHIHRELNLERMQEAAKLVLGEHDFAVFSGRGCKVEKTVRTLFRSEFSTDGDLIHYDTEGSGFLYNMVRLMVGVFLDVGYGRLQPDTVTEMFESQIRVNIGSTAPAHGLMLMSVKY